MSQIYLEINDLDSAISFIKEAKEKTGLLKDISPEKVETLLSGKEFPIRIPIKLEAVLKLAANPLVKKMAGRKIEETTKRYILAAAEG